MLEKRIVKIIKKVKKKGLSNSVKYYLEKRKTEQFLLKEIQMHHIIDEKERNSQKETVFTYSPCISIITPLYNTPELFLKQLLNSVQKQTYSNWQLCLADGSDKEHDYVGRICEEYARKDKRFVYKKLERNEGIVGNTNQAISIASGEYFGLLDHDDILHESALFECVNAIQSGADFIYTDEMRFQKSIENSTDIICKTGFGKDELRSHNYICHFVVFKKVLLDGMTNVYRKECEGSQDYDMVLRLTERAEKIVHIPKILYYWRVHKGSVAMDLSVKQYAVDAAKKAISDQLLRSGETGEVMCNLPYQTIYRVKYDIVESPVVSVCIWEENTKELQLYVEELLRNTEYRPLEIVCSSDVDIEVNDDVKLIKAEIHDGEMFYDWLERIRLNLEGEYLVLINNYCMPLEEDWIEELLMYAQRPDVGAVGSNIIYKENRVYFGGGVLDQSGQTGMHVVNYGMEEHEQGYEANMRHVRNTTFVSGLCMMVSRKKIEELGGFRVDTGDCADIDFCIRCRDKNYWNVWNCFVKVYYSGEKEMQEYWQQYETIKKEWCDRMAANDEFYPPLLKRFRKM